MSATGRSDVRVPNDVYLTPSWAVRRFLEAYSINTAATVLDPCAARGELLSVVKECRPDVEVSGMEIRPECLEGLQKVCGERAFTGDFLADVLPGGPRFDYILTNFPFSLAEEFLEHSLKVANVVITLQRLNWLRGSGRHLTMSRLKPGLFILPDRPSFTGSGTDATEYAFFAFTQDPTIQGRWFMLNETPLEARSAWNAQAREASS